ncbi:MAG: DNA polymerase Y family protein [Actinomycetota bacterium]
MTGIRMVVVWCPDWPIVSWGVPLDEPAAVLVANRVVATSPAARANGVARGQRRRDAQGRCPELAVLTRDVDREARLFEPVASALDAITPRVEVAGPGLVGFPTRGPSRFFGGDEPLARHTLDLVRPALPRRAPVRVAVADGVFAARLAARTIGDGSGARAGQGAGEAPIRILEPDGSPAFLADLPIVALEMPDLVDVLNRLGLTTLGSLAALPRVDVIGRFGREGRLAHRLASGEDDHPPDLRHPAPELAVTWAFDPPAERLEHCAFAAKALADELHHDLLARGLSCVRVAIEAETERGESHFRLWRHQGALSAADLADRARWQLDGWLNRGGPGRPTSGVVRLTLVPDEVVPARGRQLGLWGARNDRSEEVTRVVGRLQGMLGPDAVTVAEYRGGLGPGERLRLVPAAAVDLGEERPGAEANAVGEPWPGQVPPPSPAQVHPDPLPVDLVDEGGRVVAVDARGEPSAPPTTLIGAGGSGDGRSSTSRAIVGWAGPWPAEQRWWDPLTRRRRARMQVTLDDGTAHLLIIEGGAWSIEATYD